MNFFSTLIVLFFIILNNLSFSFNNAKADSIEANTTIEDENFDEQPLEEKEIKKFIVKKNKNNIANKNKIVVTNKKIGRAKSCLIEDQKEESKNVANSNGSNKKSFFDKFNIKKDLYESLIKNDISKETADAIFENLQEIEQTVKDYKNQPEIKNDFMTYFNKYNIEKKAKDAKIYTTLYKEKFAEIYEIFEIDSSIITSIWAAETLFGKIQGNFNAFNTIYTAILNTDRSVFYTKNFIALAKLVDKKILPLNVKSSWAGAIGQCQFIPLSIHQFGVSLEENGVPDLVNNKIDVFASIANYLYNKGWNSNEPVINEVSLPENFDKCLSGLHIKKTIKEWKELGIKFIEKGIGNIDITNINDEAETSIIITDINNDEVEKKKSFIVYDNFSVILGYNMSSNYAIVIGALRDLIENYNYSILQ